MIENEIPKREKVLSGGCICGCSFNTWSMEWNDGIDLEREFYKLHDGEGHGHCTFEEARKIRRDNKI